MKLVWRGHLDASCSGLLLADFAKVHGCSQVDLDLSEVTYMDSAAFGILVQLLLNVWSWNGQMKLSNPSPAVQEKLRSSLLQEAL